MLAAIIVLSYREVPFTRKRPVVVYVGFLVLWTAASPISDHLGYGQVGLFLTLLCLIDVLARPRWIPEGVLVGIAGAVKLVPLVYIGYYVITGRWKAVAGGLAGFLGATALGFAVLPRQTIDYFGDIASLSGRVAVGNPSVFGNQSVRGMALRLLPRAWWVRPGSSPVRCWVSSELSRRGALSACGAISPVSRWWLCWRQS